MYWIELMIRSGNMWPVSTQMILAWKKPSLWNLKLKQPESDCLEQVKLVFASVDENIQSSIFIRQAEENKNDSQWERFVASIN